MTFSTCGLTSACCCRGVGGPPPEGEVDLAGAALRPAAEARVVRQHPLGSLIVRAIRTSIKTAGDAVGPGSHSRSGPEGSRLVSDA